MVRRFPHLRRFIWTNLNPQTQKWKALTFAFLTSAGPAQHLHVYTCHALVILGSQLCSNHRQDMRSRSHPWSMPGHVFPGGKLNSDKEGQLHQIRTTDEAGTYKMPKMPPQTRPHDF